MKKLLFLILIMSSASMLAQDSLQTRFSLAQRTGSFAPRILKQLGPNAYTAEFTATLKYKNYFLTSFVTKDLNQITGMGSENVAGNSVLLMAGKNFTSGKLSIATRLGFFQPMGNDYFNPDINNATLIPNIFLRYKLAQNSSVGLWLNYFNNTSGDGSAFITRADYTKKFNKIGKFQIAVNYNNGFLGTDPVINGGIHFNTTPRSISKDFAMYFDFYNYYNIVEFGDTPFTNNVFGLGIVFTSK